MSRRAVLCSVGEGSCHTSRLLCCALVCFVVRVRGEICHMLRFALHYFASLRFALPGFAK